MSEMISQEMTEHTVILCQTDRDALAKLVAETGMTENMAIQAAIINESMQTEARRKASREYHKRRAEAGLKKVTLWLSPEARDALEQLKQEHGSKDAAADMAIRKLADG